jgi:hypothetical protein
MLIAATAAAALKGGVVPGLSASPTIEFVDVPPASP